MEPFGGFFFAVSTLFFVKGPISKTALLQLFSLYILVCPYVGATMPFFV
jgi:hypothetical protein